MSGFACLEEGGKDAISGMTLWDPHTAGLNKYPLSPAGPQADRYRRDSDESPCLQKSHIPTDVRMTWASCSEGDASSSHLGVHWCAFLAACFLCLASSSLHVNRGMAAELRPATACQERGTG